MENILEAIASRDLVAWIILIFLILIVIKIFKSLGTAFVFVVILGAIGFVLAQVFPGFIQPMLEFVQGGWMGD